MKKMLIGILAFITILSFETTSVLAAGSGCRRNYVDAYNNGACGYFKGICRQINTVRDNVCSHFENGCTYTDGNGICGNYTDTDNDGFCDNCIVDRGNSQAYGSSNGNGQAYSSGRFGGHHGRGHHGGHHR